MKVHLRDLAAAIAAYPEEPLEVLDDGGATLGTFMPPIAAGFIRDVSKALLDLTVATKAMRAHQCDEQLDRGAMLTLRDAEREVDRLLAELDAPPPAQGRLL